MNQGLVSESATGAVPLVASPSLASGDEAGQAYELKYRVSLEQAHWFESWAREHLTPDAYGDSGRYRVTSLYFDTPSLDVFHRLKGYRRSKYRIRRYGEAPSVFLERKSKRGGTIRKTRSLISADEIVRLASADPVPQDWDAAWFVRKLANRRLRPVCQVAYARTAFFGMAENSLVRLTIDRDVVGRPHGAWELPPLEDGRQLIPDGALLEIKFQVRMPALLQALQPRLPSPPDKVSKYRQCVNACGLKAETPDSPDPMPDAAPGAADASSRSAA